MELLWLSKSCEIAKTDAEKLLSPGGEEDVYKILGSVYSGYGDFASSVRFSRMALELTPNGNSQFITNNLGSKLYLLAHYQETKDVIEDNIDAEENLITIIAVFASLEFMDGNKNAAERLLKRAKSQDIDKEIIRAGSIRHETLKT